MTNKQDAAWRGFIEMLEYTGDLYGTHVVQVDPAGTTKECAECGVETEKPLWVREHSCPSCGFEADRDANASYNVLSRGLQQLGKGHAKVTPVETATAVETDGGRPSPVPASRVIETGSLGDPEAVHTQGQPRRQSVRVSGLWVRGKCRLQWGQEYCQSILRVYPPRAEVSGWMGHQSTGPQLRDVEREWRLHACRITRLERESTGKPRGDPEVVDTSPAFSGPVVSACADRDTP